RNGSAGRLRRSWVEGLVGCRDRVSPTARGWEAMAVGNARARPYRAELSSPERPAEYTGWLARDRALACVGRRAANRSPRSSHFPADDFAVCADSAAIQVCWVACWKARGPR